MRVQSDGVLIALDKGRNCRNWKLQVSLGYDSLTGRYRKTSRTVHDMSKTEAKDELRRFILELQNQSTLDANTVTVGAYADEWLNGRKNAAQPPRAGTLRNNDVAVRTIMSSSPKCRARGVTSLPERKVTAVSTIPRIMVVDLLRCAETSSFGMATLHCPRAINGKSVIRYLRFCLALL